MKGILRLENKITYCIFIVVGIILLIFSSCREHIKREITHYKYCNASEEDSLSQDFLVAVTNEEYLEYGSSVAYVNTKGDTIIPFGRYVYFGTDSLFHFANVMLLPTDTCVARQVAIDKNQRILYDIVIFDNGPDPFSEGYVRVLRNGKMGYANKYGQIVIPCIYAFAKQFANGKAEVAFHAKEYMDLDEHRRVESDEWFKFDRKGNRIE